MCSLWFCEWVLLVVNEIYIYAFFDPLSSVLYPSCADLSEARSHRTPPTELSFNATQLGTNCSCVAGLKLPLLRLLFTQPAQQRRGKCSKVQQKFTVTNSGSGPTVTDPVNLIIRFEDGLGDAFLTGNMMRKLDKKLTCRAIHNRWQFIWQRMRPSNNNACKK